MKHLLLAFSIFLTLQTSFAQSRISYANYDQVLNEKFQYRTLDELAQNWQLQPEQAFVQGTALFTPSQVSLLPQGGIRLTATPLQNFLTAREPKGKDIYYKSGMISKKLDQNYGIYRILVKMPNGQTDVNDAWPVFKLVGENVNINIIDAPTNLNDDLRQNVSTKTNPDTRYQCGNVWDLEDFHEGWDKGFFVFQAVWTPEAITFLIHGREVSTVKADQLAAPMESLSLVVALQTNEISDQPMYMDVKSVSVFKHKEGRPYTYLADYSWEFHNATSSLFDSKVLAQNGAILPNPNNTNEVFYIGQDQHLYLAKMIDKAWDVKPISDQIIAGSLTYVKPSNTILFKGQDGRLHGLTRAGNTFKAFAKQNIHLANQPNTLATTQNGNIIAILANRTIAYLDNDLSLTAMANIDYAGDLTVMADETILYKDHNHQLKALKQQDLSFKIVELPVIQLSKAAGSILFHTYRGKEAIAFRGVDNKFHLLEKISDNQYSHQVPAYDYELQDPKHPDYIASNLAGGSTDIFYLSKDGRLQLFGWENAQRKHFWVDDNFFTQNYLADISAPSLAFGANGQLYYRTKEGSLGYFQWESSKKGCDCETIHVNNEQNTLEVSANLEAFPNPTMGQLKMTIHNFCATCTYHYELVAANGQRITKGIFEGNEHTINFEKQPAGIYQLNIVSETDHFTKRIVKMK